MCDMVTSVSSKCDSLTKTPSLESPPDLPFVAERFAPPRRPTAPDFWSHVIKFHNLTSNLFPTVSLWPPLRYRVLRVPSTSDGVGLSVPDRYLDKSFPRASRALPSASRPLDVRRRGQDLANVHAVRRPPRPSPYPADAYLPFAHILDVLACCSPSQNPSTILLNPLLANASPALMMQHEPCIRHGYHYGTAFRRQRHRPGRGRRAPVAPHGGLALPARGGNRAPTTDFLNPTEHAQVFGQTPDAADFLPDSPASHGGEPASSSFLDVGTARGGSRQNSRGHPHHPLSLSPNALLWLPFAAYAHVAHLGRWTARQVSVAAVRFTPVEGAKKRVEGEDGRKSAITG
ncbi:hypothetical protein B0H11DRAFT_2309539 [Mycena galericulata]|nr:hypothetical protein B0H11DRAFT_2309539 [Mycena galericulata]